jgi:diguanylate cyclase (GGDEF)-like protein
MDDRFELLSDKHPSTIIRRRISSTAIVPAQSRSRDASGPICPTQVVLRPPGAAPATRHPDYDASTGLPTLKQMSVLINGVIVDARRYHRAFALVTFDLDGFRMLCEAYGAAIGDEIIKLAASAVGTVHFNNTLIARHGNDGFILVLIGVANAADTAVCVQQILDAIAVPIEIATRRLRVSASAGIAMFPNDGEDLDTLVRNAHVAMRESKVNCPGALRFHSGNLAALAKRRFHLAIDLRQAIENNALTLFYQPQFEVVNGRACGVEVLARWFRPDGTVVDPSVFIPLAEQTQLIGALGFWVLQEACKIVKAWPARGAGLITLCVNVSPYQLDEAFPAAIQRVLDGTGFPAGQLELEITESALIGNADTVIECFRQLKLIGVRIAIDDFGTGYSSLNYLSRLPADRLKLDKSLIHNLTTQWKDVAILHSIIRLGKELGVAVIAEGVETEQQLQLLKQLGCPQVQGYLLARPAAQNEVKRVLVRRWGNRRIQPRFMDCVTLSLPNAS